MSFLNEISSLNLNSPDYFCNTNCSLSFDKISFFELEANNTKIGDVLKKNQTTGFSNVNTTPTENFKPKHPLYFEHENVFNITNMQ